MDPWHNDMLTAGKSLPRRDDIAEQLIAIVKILHMMPALRVGVLRYVQEEVQHYLAKPNDFMRTQNGELVIKEPNKDYRFIYEDKSTAARGW